MRTDWSPMMHLSPQPAPQRATLSGPSDALRAATPSGGGHNGYPEVRPYVWRDGDAEREEWLAATLADIRTRARRGRRGG